MRNSLFISSLVIFAGALFSVAILVPDIVYAQNFFDGPLVSCTGTGCGACELVDLGKNILLFLVSMATLVATGMFVYAGILYSTSGPNPEQIEQAHKIFFNVVIGLVIVLAAWLVVDTVLRVLPSGAQRSGVAPWAEVICTAGKNLENLSSADLNPNAVSSNGSGGGTGGGVTGGSTAPASATCSSNTCIPLDSSIDCKSETCLVSEGLNQELTGLNEDYDGDWRVTEAWPPTTSAHGRSCHNNGECVDANFTGTYYDLGWKCNAGNCSDAELDQLAAEVKRFRAAAEGGGAWAQYEVSNASLEQALVTRGVPAKGVFRYSGATGPHFNVLRCEPSSPGNSCYE